MKDVIYGERRVYPSKIVCIGRNYVEHIEELGNEIPENMVVFNKPNSALSDRLRYFSRDTRFEAELCLLIENGEIVALGVGLDLTLADTQRYLKEKGLPWERAKAFDGSAIMTPFVHFEGSMENIAFELRIDGRRRQRGEYSLMIYKPHEIVREVAGFMSFEDGDIVMTGTPRGVGSYSEGELFELRLYDGERLLTKGSWRVE